MIDSDQLGSARISSDRGRGGSGRQQDTARDADGFHVVIAAESLHEQGVRTTAVLESMLVGYLSMDADWRITYVNAEAERVAGSTREELLGHSFWEVFPATVDSVFEASYRRARSERVDAVFDAYYPPPLDVWVQVRATPEGEGLALYFVDITARQRAYQARDLAARQLQRIAQFTLALGRVQSIEDLVHTVAEDGLLELGCNGGSVAIIDPDDEQTLLSHLTSSYGRDSQVEYGRLPLSVDLPVARAARTGRSVLLNDRAACLAFSPLMEGVLSITGSQAFACLPLHAGEHVIGVVTAGWDTAQLFDVDQLIVLNTFAAQVAQALQRLRALNAERAAARKVAGMSEALQRSLLTELPEPDHLELVARYVAATDENQVGGDWYDAFMVRDGSTCIVVGDVTGHDQSAAVQMAQVRNVLRGVAHAMMEPPATILQSLDRAMHDLATGALATTVLAKIEQGPEDAALGLRTLRWSNAGHLPPLLLHPDGRAELLERPSDLMLGLGVDTDRHDHTHHVQPSSTVLFYTDGLVERRGEHLDDGLRRLVEIA
ncbi:MAG: SpoIIE family protein phosphatase, partial [Janthinobacterium lividum]